MRKKNGFLKEDPATKYEQNLRYEKVFSVAGNLKNLCYNMYAVGCYGLLMNMNDIKRRSMKAFLSALCMGLLGGISVSAQSPEQPDGVGNAASPYQIKSVGNLLWMSMNTFSSQGTYYEIAADIDASETSSWYGGQGFQPIGSESSHFRGKIIGKNHTISNLSINRAMSPHVGLLGFVEGGSVENLNLKNCTVSGQMYAGILAGYMNGSSVTGCKVSGKVSCYGNYAGGIVGQAYQTPISKSCADQISVYGANYVGGIVGENLAGSTLAYCYSVGSVANNNGTYAGGLTGWSHEKISICYSRTTVSGSDRVGGLAGQSSNPIEQCYAAGNVYGQSNAGGLAGYSGRDITNSYWDKQLSGLEVCIGSDTSFGKNLGLTTQQMKQRNSYAGWDFNSVWGMSSSFNNGYPYLKGFTGANSFLGESDIYFSTGEDGLILEWLAEKKGKLEYSQDLVEWQTIPDAFIQEQNKYNIFKADSISTTAGKLFFRLAL